MLAALNPSLIETDPAQFLPVLYGQYLFMNFKPDRSVKERYMTAMSATLPDWTLTLVGVHGFRIVRIVTIPELQTLRILFRHI